MATHIRYFVYNVLYKFLLIMQLFISRFNDDDDDVNEYNPTDSEDELPAKEKELLKKARSKGAKYSDSEVYK